MNLYLQNEPRDSTSDTTLWTVGSQSDTAPNMADWDHGASILENSNTNNKKKITLSIWKMEKKRKVIKSDKGTS